MNHTTCTILQYAAFLRGHGYCETELQEEIIATLEVGSVEPFRLRGHLAAVQILTQIANGIQNDLLSVTLNARSGNQTLQVAMSDKVGQALVRKLWHAVPGEETEFLIWTIADDGSDAASECGLQYATVRQAGKDLRGTDSANPLPLVEAAQAPFVTAGITDKATLQIVEVQAILRWHLNLLDMTIAKFAAHVGSANGLATELSASTQSENALQDDDPFGLEEAIFASDTSTGSSGGHIGFRTAENPTGALATPPNPVSRAF